MKQFFKTSLILCMLLLAATVVPHYAFRFPPSAVAATSNPASGSAGYELMAVPISAITTTTSAIYKFKTPWPVRIVSMSASANAITGIVTLNLKNAAGTSLLSSAMTVSTTAGIVTDATLTTSSSTLNITDETAFQIDTAGTGTADHVSILLGIKRL